jgi:DhnA family fructose-bisphosphate aldolase class Ia
MSGKIIRMNRIFDKDGRSVVIAIDHGQFQGAIDGIKDMPETLKNITAGNPDAIIINPGVLEKHGNLIPKNVSVILRITGASTNYSTQFDYHRQTTSVSHALELGADAVIVMGFIAGDGENQSLCLIGEVAQECNRKGVPLVVEMLPQDMEHFTDPKYIGIGARSAYELGADVIKIYYTGKESFQEITSSVPIPVLVAGGPKDKEAFETARESINSGAKGIAFGRNCFQAEEPCNYVKKLVEIVHKK